MLIGLREDIRRIYPDIPREQSILRRNMIDAFINKKINNIEKFNNLHEEVNEKIDERQNKHLKKSSKLYLKLIIIKI